jgi:hypothetical protein|tara:strand:+ start:1949 stop:2059 length:111 start_codon:yes stop_codon:yes gene_type:complete
MNGSKHYSFLTLSKKDFLSRVATGILLFSAKKIKIN